MDEKTKENGEQLTYEQAFAGLEAIVRKMESGELTLDESIKAYEEGTRLLKNCEAELERYEKIIGKITKA